MAEAKRYPMTIQGHQALKDELHHLKTVERPKIIDQVEEARSHGDLKENAEYHAAREKYGFIQGRMSSLAEKLAQAEIVNPKEMTGEKITFGATVRLEDVDLGEEVTYQIVGEDQADVKKGLLNYQSPLARALIGKQGGDEIEVKLPKGLKTFEILDVKFI